MKKLVLLAILASIMFLQSCDMVPAGNVGIKFYLLGGSKGVDTEVLSPGRYWIGVNEKLYTFPVFTQNYTWTQDRREGSPIDESITFQTREGMSVGADVGITYKLQKAKVPYIFEKYKKGVKEITNLYVRNMIRDAFNIVASTMPIQSVYGSGKQKLLKEVEDMVRKQIGKDGIDVEKIYLVGNLRLPTSVTEALNRKIEATQRAEQRENELREAEAEAKKLIAKAEGEAKSLSLKADAQAQANILLNASLTKNLVQYKAIEKWDGKLPSTTTGGSIPLLKIN